jgi:D-arginine dehydrogenase
MGRAGTGTEVVVVGGGIAGVSAAAFAAAAGASVTLVEREPALSSHTSGRSAALYLASYGLAQTRRLTLASRPFLDDPPDGFADAPLLSPRGVVWVGAAGDAALLRQAAVTGRAVDPSVSEIDGSAVRQLCPVLRPDHAVAGVFEPSAADMDVAAIHAGFVRLLRRGGGTVLRGAGVTALRRNGTGWTVSAGAATVQCDVVVDAAGAWGDQVAELAQLAPLGLRPLRRTAMTVGVPPGTDVRGWPSVNHVRGTWYFKPEGDGLLVSPADQTPSAPCDARPDPLDVAIGLERVAEATTLPLRSVRTAWAGLRTFSPDGELVIGPERQDGSFVWCVGQGGYGIQSAAAAGRLTADLALGQDVEWATSAGIDVPALGPQRLRTHGEQGER